MSFFLTVVVCGLSIAVGASIVSFRSNARSQWWLAGGALLIGAGVASAYGGFGSAWMASLEGRSQTPGVIAFFAGLGATFAGIGLLLGRAARAVRNLVHSARKRPTQPSDRAARTSSNPYVRVPDEGGTMSDRVHTSRASRDMIVRLVATVAASTLIAMSVPAHAEEPPEVAQRRFTVMTYNVYLGANLQPLFGVRTIDDLIRIGDGIFRHLDQVDFNDRAVAIAEQIGEQEPDLVALQEVALWQTAPYPAGTPLTTKYDFLQILMNELERQQLSYEVLSVNDNFHGEAPISLAPPTLGVFTDRNVIIARTDLPTSELMTANPREANYDAALVVPLLTDAVRVERGWASVDVTIRGKTYRFFDTHFEAFHPVRRAEQVGELVEIMSGSPYPVVLAGDINLYPQAVGRPVDVAPWRALEGAGFVDAWVQADCFEPRDTAGQTDDLDNVPSILDNTVDYVLYDADFDIEAIEHSCDIAGEELDDRTATVPTLWPSDHAAVVLNMHIAKP